MYKKYLHLRSHIYISYFNQEIIVLDLKQNRYLVLTESLSEVLSELIKREFLYENKKYFLTNHKKNKKLDITSDINLLISLGILSPKLHSSPCNPTIRKNVSIGGANNIDWRLKWKDIDKKVSIKSAIQAFFILFKVHFITRAFGFLRLVQTIKSKNKAHFIYNNKTEDLYELAAVLNRACLYFPIKTKCLEWSAALVLLGLSKKHMCNLEIGIQNIPFAAHAWVNAGGVIIADDQNLRDDLSIILSEPFNEEGWKTC